MLRIVFVIGAFFRERLVDGLEFSGHVGDLSRRGMASGMCEARERKRVRSAATLMINSEGVSARESAGNAVINKKRKRTTQPRHDQTIFARSFKRAEISFKHPLITSVRKTSIWSGLQLPVEKRFPRARLN